MSQEENYIINFFYEKDTQVYIQRKEMQCKAFDERYKVYTFTTNVISYSYNELKKTLKKKLFLLWCT